MGFGVFRGFGFWGFRVQGFGFRAYLGIQNLLLYPKTEAL